MGINRDSRHKHRKTGGRRNIHQKKRKFERGRPCVMCHMGAKRVRPVRGRGGNMKYRALRLDTGNVAWGSECCSRKVRIIDVVYNASSNELVRTKTLCKNAIIQVDCQPFKQWYLRRYGIDLGRKTKGPKQPKEEEKKEEKEEAKDTKEDKKGKKKGKQEEKKEEKKEADPDKRCRHVLAKQAHRAAKQKLDPLIEEQFQGGRLLACISSRPGQSGRVDAYVIEGEDRARRRRELHEREHEHVHAAIAIPSSIFVATTASASQGGSRPSISWTRVSDFGIKKDLIDIIVIQPYAYTSQELNFYKRKLEKKRK